DQAGDRLPHPGYDRLQPVPDALPVPLQDPGENIEDALDRAPDAFPHARDRLAHRGQDRHDLVPELGPERGRELPERLEGALQGLQEPADRGFDLVEDLACLLRQPTEVELLSEILDCWDDRPAQEIDNVLLDRALERFQPVRRGLVKLIAGALRRATEIAELFGGRVQVHGKQGIGEVFGLGAEQLHGERVTLHRVLDLPELVQDRVKGLRRARTTFGDFLDKLVRVQAHLLQGLNDIVRTDDGVDLEFLDRVRGVVRVTSTRLESLLDQPERLLTGQPKGPEVGGVLVDRVDQVFGLVDAVLG